MGAVRVTGRNFVLEDPEKLLYHWASVRNLSPQTIYKAVVLQDANQIEARMPPSVIFGGFTAAKESLKTPPADYDRVFVYTHDLAEIKKRFPLQRGRENLFVLKADRFLAEYGQITSLAQTFVDLWNLPEWNAKEYAQAIKEKIDGLLS
jgi:hypothetical protein